jgi:hypothetical protein
MANALSEMDAYMKALHKTLKKKVTSGHTVWIIHPTLNSFLFFTNYLASVISGIEVF